MARPCPWARSEPPGHGYRHDLAAGQAVGGSRLRDAHPRSVRRTPRTGRPETGSRALEAEIRGIPDKDQVRLSLTDQGVDDLRRTLDALAHPGSERNPSRNS
jgi:hypothetical protein